MNAPGVGGADPTVARSSGVSRSPSSAPAAIRTRDLRLRRPTLYPTELLAREAGVWFQVSGVSRLHCRCEILTPDTRHLFLKSGRVDLNHRPPGPEPGALTGLRYAPKFQRLRGSEAKPLSRSASCAQGDSNPQPLDP